MSAPTGLATAPPEEEMAGVPEEPAEDAEQTGGPRWFQRVLPMVGVGLVVLLLAALVSPGFRHQLGLSMTRHSQSYAELYFAPAPGAKGQAVCTRRGATAQVRFVVTSHLDGARTLAYRVVLDPKAKGLRTQRRAGSAGTTPGSSVPVTTSFRLPRREGYTVTVRLPALGQVLRAHCGGAAK